MNSGIAQTDSRVPGNSVTHGPVAFLICQMAMDIGLSDIPQTTRAYRLSFEVGHGGMLRRVETRE